MKCRYHLCRKEFELRKKYPTQKCCSRVCGSRFYGDRRRHKLKLMAINIKGGKCQKCGYNKCRAALSFHHRDPSTKKFGISSWRHVKWDDVKQEIEKCDLLCSNCHMEIEHLELELIKEELHEYWREPEPARQYYCLDCGRKVTRKCDRCKKCHSKNEEKIKWPTRKELEERLKKTSYVKLGQELGVTDNAIRKRLKNHLN